MRLLACLIVAPQRYDEPAILSYAISSFCPTSANGLHQCRLGLTSFDLAPFCAAPIPNQKRSLSIALSAIIGAALCGYTMLTSTVNFPTRRTPSPQIRARDTSNDGASNGSAGVNSAPDVHAGANGATHLGGQRCRDHDDRGDSTNY